MKKVYLALCFILMLLHLSCKESISSYPNNVDFSEAIKIKINPGESNDHFPLDSIIDSVSYLQLDLQNRFAIKFLHKVEFFNSRMLIHDRGNEEALLCTEDGILIQKLGNKGKGPGEFLGIANVNYNPYSNSIDLFTGLKRNIIRFDIENGNFIQEYDYGTRERQLPYLANVTPIDELQYLVSNVEFQPEEEDWNHHFFILDFENSNISKKWLPFRPFERRSVKAYFDVRFMFNRFGNELTAYYWNSPVIYSYDSNEINPKYQFIFHNTEFHPNVLSLDEMKAIYQTNGVCCLDHLYETEDYIIGTYRYKDYWGETFIYSKETAKTVIFNDASIINPFNGHNFRIPVGVKGKQIVFSVAPSAFISSYDNNINALLPLEKNKLESFISRIDKNRDDILIFYTLKKF